MEIYDAADALLLKIDVDDDSYRYRAVAGDDNMVLKYSLAEHVELPVGAYCEYQSRRYTLMRPEAIKMRHTRLFEYTVTMESPQCRAKMWKFRNTVDRRLKFPLTAKPREHLQMFVDNMNGRDPGWAIGSCIEGDEHLISYDHDYCWDALARMASEFDTEFEIVDRTVSLGKVEYNKDNPLPLAYGKGNGFRSGVGRANDGDNPPTETLYVQGGTQNIDRSRYPAEETLRASANGSLLLPRNATIGYDGSHFDDEAGYDAAAARLYATDGLGLSVRRADLAAATLAEDSLDCSDCYPKRVGNVSAVVCVSEEDNFYDFTDDTIPDTLDYNDCLIPGETMTVIFQSGMLAGREFEVKYVHEAIESDDPAKAKPGRRFEIVPQEEDGITMPGGAFVPSADGDGDRYAVFHCMLPDAYIADDATRTGAEWDMLRKAVRHLHDRGEQKYTFTGELDGIWAKKDWENIGGRLVPGGYVSFTDARFQPDPVLIRIVGIKDYVNRPHSPELELSNATVGGSFSTRLDTLASTEVTIEQARHDAIAYTRRRFRDAKETMEMLERAMLGTFSSSISPVTVHTMSMLVGDESLQFRFVDDADTPEEAAHNIAYDASARRLSCPAGLIQHMTLGVSDITAARPASAYKYWRLPAYESAVLDDAQQAYYLYAMVGATDNGAVGAGEFRLEREAQPLERAGGGYALLVGILNSESGGDRSFATLYGFTEILPGRITTDRVVSTDGRSFFDLANAAMRLGDRLRFNLDGDGRLILSGTLVQSGSGDTSGIGCFRGAWDSTKSYYVDDEVTYYSGGCTSQYRCIKDTTPGIAPTNTTYWKVVAQGSKGDPGDDGTSPNTAFKSTVFKRSDANPGRPSNSPDEGADFGGSYANPVPAGWSDGVPDGELPLWASTRIFSSDGLSPQQPEWTDPMQMTDTADFDVEFCDKETYDAPPQGHPNTNAEWSDAATTATIWMATSTCKNGTWSPWQISKIKGEKGNDGTSINIKGSLDSVDDLPMTGNVEGDCYIIGGDLYVWDGDSWVNAGRFKGEPGDSAYVHIKYANSLTEGDWTYSGTVQDGETPGPYIGIYCDSNSADRLVWSLYTWTRWRGEDGFGYEYVYKRTATGDAPATPTYDGVDEAAWNVNDYVPSGWTDDPTGVDATMPYEWVCHRQRTEGTWGAFRGSAADPTKAALWAKFGKDGISPNAAFKSFVFRRTNTAPARPGNSTAEGADFGGTYANPVPAGWSDGVPDGEEILWMTSRVFSSDGLDPQDAQWAEPRQMTDTADFDVDFSSLDNPPTPTAHPNEYLMENGGDGSWSNTADDTTVWMATCRKANGVWGAWSIAKIKGERGEDGTSIKVKGQAKAHYASDAERQAANGWPRGSLLLVDGDDGGNTGPYTYYAEEAGLNSDGSTTNSGRYALSTVGDGYLCTSDGHLWMADSAGWADCGQFKGDPGANAFMHIKYASSMPPNASGGCDWTENNGETPGPYIGVYCDNSSADSSNWADYTWHKWRGEDGLGYEYIYRRTADYAAPDVPTATTNAATGKTAADDDFFPSGWTDDPTGVDADNPYEWVCYRVKAAGAWGAFRGSSSDAGKAALWAKYGQDGIPGRSSFKSTVFTRLALQPSAPDPGDGSYTAPVPERTYSATDGTTYSWEDGVPAGSLTLWASTRIFSSDGLAPQQDAWTTPRRMTSTASFQVKFSSLLTDPGTPDSPAAGAAWGDTAGPDTVWMATRTCTDGVWSAWQVARIKGENGISTTIAGTADGWFESPDVFADFLDAQGAAAAGRLYLVDGESDDAFVADVNAAATGYASTAPDDGVSYVLSTDGHLRTKQGSAWVDCGQFRGEDGKNGENGEDGPAIVFRGVYSSTATYYGTPRRTDVVKYSDGAYYATKRTAGEFSGIAPASGGDDDPKWTQFGASFESVATGLLLAEEANIANLIFRNERLESVSRDGSTPNFYIDGKTGEASFAQGKVVFSADGSARLGWIYIDEDDLVGVDGDGVERLRITPGPLPTAAGASATTYPEFISVTTPTDGAGAANVGPTEFTVLLANALHDGGDDTHPDGTDTCSLTAYVVFDVSQPGATLYLGGDGGGIQYAASMSDARGNAIAGSAISHLCTATVHLSTDGGATYATRVGAVALSSGQRTIVVPAAGRVKVTVRYSIEVTGYSYWKGSMRIFCDEQGGLVSETTTKEQTFIAADGIMSIYNSNYMRFHSTDGFAVKVGSYGLRVTPSGVQKMTDGASWTAL